MESNLSNSTVKSYLNLSLTTQTKIIIFYAKHLNGKVNLAVLTQVVNNVFTYSSNFQSLPGTNSVCVWAVGANGDALFRKDVTLDNPIVSLI